MNQQGSQRAQRHSQPRAALRCVAAMAIMLGACGSLDRLLEVQVPSAVAADDLDDPRHAAMLVTGAVGDFECALGNYIFASGLIGEELEAADLVPRLWSYDRRDLSPDEAYHLLTCDNAPGGVYAPLSIARFQADDVLRRLESWSESQVPDRDELIATAAGFSGYSLILLGEGMCSAAFDVGPERSPPEIFALAEERFTRALQAAEAAGHDALLNLARIGRARARLNQGKLSEAAADAGPVPDGFVYYATTSATVNRRRNVLFAANNRDEIVTVENPFRSVMHQGVADPRVEIVDAERMGKDGLTPLWLQRKYDRIDSPIPIARWEEARLILAEAVGGQQAVDIINELHERAALPRFESNDPDEIRQHIIQERRHELFLEGHHLGDVNRYGMVLTPLAGTPYPPKAGGVYGNSTCFPLPSIERNNNPNIP